MKDFCTGLAFVSVITIAVSLILGALGILEYVVFAFGAFFVLMFFFTAYRFFENS